jgi:glycerol-3-phosphate dehydrogenase
LHKLAKKHNLDLPILEETYKVIYEGASPKETVKRIINIVK